jgi:hypothetical protein
MKRIILITVFVLGFCAGQVYSDGAIDNPEVFAELNPDGIKYEFVKRYLMALEYLRKSEDLRESLTENLRADFSAETLRARAGQILQENANIRVARNLVERYQRGDNGFVLKAGKIFLNTCEALINLNNQERDVIMDLIARAAGGEPIGGEAAGAYLAGQNRFFQQRKTVSAGIVEASLYVSKLLLSGDLNVNGRIYRLGISIAERDKLIKQLDGFPYPPGVTELQPGQTFVEGGVAVIRRVLQDGSLGTLDG